MMETAPKHHGIEAVLPAHNTARVLGSDSQAGASGQLPPERPRLDGMSSTCSGVKSSDSEARGKILALEAAMLSMPQVAIETTHYFAPGIYMRQVFIPKGTTVTGMIHKTEHMNILSQGNLMVWTEDGMKTLTASTVVKSLPGIKRVGHALEDSVWITVHHNPDNLRDVEQLESMLITNRFEDVLPFAEPNQMLGGV